ncbi:MAG: hypothetical protein JO072_01775 [Parafilimonas sp.]|nr:hypothetical protein [Parafilimonas sp.]
MKTQNSNKLHACIFFFIAMCIFCNCKKQETLYSKTNSNTVNSIASDGIVTVQASILPPTTSQSFIPNGSTSVAQFQITSSQHIYLIGGGFNATYPLLEYIVIGFPWINNGGFCSGDLGGDIYTNQGTTITSTAYYLPVDSSTSGSVVKLAFRSLTYRTDDETYYTLYANNPVEAQDMCLVNNVPHITFQSPGNTVLNNGYSEVADVKLSGDTNWTLNSLPLFISSFSGGIDKCKLIVRSNGNQLSTKSDSIKLDYGLTAQTVINFKEGFRHIAGKKETLKIYANVTGGSGSILLHTRLYPFSSLKWTDGLGILIPGAKNAKFFKEDVGMAELHK